MYRIYLRIFLGIFASTRSIFQRNIYLLLYRLLGGAQDIQAVFCVKLQIRGNLVELDKNLNNDTSIGFVLRKISRIIQTEVSVICQSESRFKLHPTIIPLTTIINYQHDRGDNRSHNSFVSCLRFILYFFKLKQYSTVITY